MFKRIGLILITLAALCGNVYASQKAASIEFLLSQVRTSTTSLTGGKVYAYEVGTTTPKTIWLDRNKSQTANNPYTLDSNGTAQIFGDGLYRLVIKDSAGVTKFDRDGLFFVDALSAGVERVDTDFTSLNDAITTIGSTPTTLKIITSGFPLIANVSLPSNITLDFVYPGYISSGSYQVTGLKESRPEWFGANTTPGTTDMSTAFTKALAASKHVVLQAGTNYFLSTGVSIANSGTIIDFNGATVTGGAGITVFTIPHTVNNIKFLHGTITGSYADAIKTTGTGSVLASTGSYDLTVDDMKILGGTTGINLYQRFDRAYISNSSIFTTNGVIMNGKIADVHISNCLIAGSSTAGSYGVRSQNPIGTGSNYPEGLRISNTLITNHATGVCLDDIYDFIMSGGFVQPMTGGKSVQIALDRATTITKYIKFIGVLFSYGPFVISESGYNADYSKYVNISNCQFTSTYLQIDANSNFVDVNSSYFVSPDAVTSVMTVGNNVGYLNANNITVFGNYTNGVVITGATGPHITLRDWVFEDGGGYPAIVKLTTARAITSHNMDTTYEQTGAVIAPATVSGGGTIKTLAFNIGAYQKFIINLVLDYTTAAANTLAFNFSPNILGWYGGINTAQVILPAAAAVNHVEHQIFGIAGSDGVVTITIVNGGSSLSISGDASYVSAMTL